MSRLTVKFSVEDIGDFECWSETTMRDNAIIEMELNKSFGFERNFFFKRQIGDFKRQMYQKAEKAVFGDKPPEKYVDADLKKIDDWIDQNDATSRDMISKS